MPEDYDNLYNDPRSEYNPEDPLVKAQLGIAPYINNIFEPLENRLRELGKLANSNNPNDMGGA